MDPGLVIAALVALFAAPSGDEVCQVVGFSGMDPTAEEVRAVRSSCRDARERLAELFGEAARPVRVVVWDRPGYRTAVQGDTAVVFWPALRIGDGHDEAMLPHEIAHALLAARLHDGVPRRDGGYGTALPDWLEEGVAIWAEPPGQRAARIAHARALPDEELDLPRILAGSHPAAGNSRLLSIRDGAAPPADDALWTFYPKSIAVLAFLFETGGPAAVRELVARYSADPASERGLRGLPGLPSGETELVRAWNAWVRSGS